MTPCTPRGALSGLSRDELGHSAPAEAGPRRPGSSHGLRGGRAGLGRGPGLLWGSWHRPTPDLARKQRLSLRGCAEVSPDHPTHTHRPAAPGHLGETKTPVNFLQNSPRLPRPRVRRRPRQSRPGRDARPSPCPGTRSHPDGRAPCGAGGTDAGFPGGQP